MKRAENSAGAGPLDALMDAAVDAIIIIDDKGSIRRFNGAAEAMFGYSEAEVRGRNVAVLMPEPVSQREEPLSWAIHAHVVMSVLAYSLLSLGAARITHTGGLPERVYADGQPQLDRDTQWVWRPARSSETGWPMSSSTLRMASLASSTVASAARRSSTVQRRRRPTRRSDR